MQKRVSLSRVCCYNTDKDKINTDKDKILFYSQTCDDAVLPNGQDTILMNAPESGQRLGMFQKQRPVKKEPDVIFCASSKNMLAWIYCMQFLNKHSYNQSIIPVNLKWND